MKRAAKKAVNYIKNAFITATSRATWLPADSELPIDSLPNVRGVVFEVTNACNSRCISCNIWQTPVKSNLLTVSEVEKIFSDPLFEELESVIVTGGEPALRKDLEELILAINRIRPKALISLSTNGLLPDRVLSIVKTCLEKGMELFVGVSLDALGQEHDRVRGVEGNFAKVDYLINALNKLESKYPCKLHVIVGQTFSPFTVDHVVEVKEYAEKLGAAHLLQLYEEFSYYSNTEETRKNLKLPQHIEGTAGHHLSDSNIGLQAYKSDPIKILESLPPSIQNEIMIRALKSNQPIMHPTRYSRNFCASMNSFFLLRANGDIAPCLRWSHIPMGNFREGSPSEVWMGKAAREGRKLVRECGGCSNTWATSWSAERWFPPFTILLLKTFFNSKMTKTKTTK